MSLLDHFPHTCTARRRKRVSDGMAGFNDSFDDVVFTGRECWRQPAADNEVTWWQARGIDVTNTVFFPDDPGLDVDCVLDFADGWRFDVKSYAQPDDSAGMGMLWRIMVQRIGRV